MEEELEEIKFVGISPRGKEHKYGTVWVQKESRIVAAIKPFEKKYGFVWLRGDWISKVEIIPHWVIIHLKLTGEYFKVPSKIDDGDEERAKEVRVSDGVIAKGYQREGNHFAVVTATIEGEVVRSIHIEKDLVSIYRFAGDWLIAKVDGELELRSGWRNGV